jgi:hypothetical protein
MLINRTYVLFVMIINNIMDFYTRFEEAKIAKEFKIKDIAALLQKDYDAVRMAAKRKSFSELEKRTITERYFVSDISTNTPEDISVNDPFELEFIENSNSNSFSKLENGQYLMTMPLADYDIQAGFLDVYQDIEQLKELGKHSIIVDKPVKGRYIAFRVKGDSMDSGRTHAITERSIVTTRELGRQNWNSKLRFKDFPLWVIYTTQSKMPLLKQIIDHDVEKATIKCHSLNESPEYVDFDLSLNDVQALFYVIDVSRSVSRYEEY